MIDLARHGKLGAREQGPRTLFKAINAYFEGKRLRCSARTIELEEERLSLVKKHFGDVRLSAITAGRIAEYQQVRHDAGRSNRTINMDVGVLFACSSRPADHAVSQDHVRALPERQSLIGRALTR